MSIAERQRHNEVKTISNKRQKSYITFKNIIVYNQQYPILRLDDHKCI